MTKRIVAEESQRDSKGRFKKGHQEKLKHGHAFDGAKTKEWRAWTEMKKRCNPGRATRFPDHAGRGIKVCSEWQNSFQAFIDSVGFAPEGNDISLDRIDNNGNYEPGNVRWATRTEQMRNKRSNRIIEAFGKSMCLSEWAEETGIPAMTIAYRIDSGWTLEISLTKAVRGSLPGIMHEGKLLTVKEYAIANGISYDTARRRALK